MKLIWNLAWGVILAAAVGLMPAEPVQVGTFNKQSVVVAFYRSPQWAETLKAKRAELEAAKKANDTKKAEDLKAWGGAQQELAHRQLAGEAPITNILEALTPAFSEIAQKAQVAIIVSDLVYSSPAVQNVDVTDFCWTG